jgi:hypothetical protein
LRWDVRLKKSRKVEGKRALRCERASDSSQALDKQRNYAHLATEAHLEILGRCPSLCQGASLTVLAKPSRPGTGGAALERPPAPRVAEPRRSSVQFFVLLSTATGVLRKQDMLLTDWGETDGTQASLVHFSSKLACGLANFASPIGNWISFLENTAVRRRDQRRQEYGDERSGTWKSERFSSESCP